jgi:hypothetical protein
MRVAVQHNVSRHRRTCITGVGLHRRLPASSQFDLDVVGVAQDDEGTPALSIYVLNTRMRQSEWRDPNNKTALSDLGPRSSPSTCISPASAALITGAASSTRTSLCRCTAPAAGPHYRPRTGWLCLRGLRSAVRSVDRRIPPATPRLGRAVVFRERQDARTLRLTVDYAAPVNSGWRRGVEILQ